MASRVWARSPKKDGLTIYGQSMEGGCVFTVCGPDSAHLAFSSFLKLCLEYKSDETTCLLIDMNAREVLVASEAGFPDPLLYDVRSLFSFLKNQMKTCEEKTFCVVLNGLDETDELLEEMNSLLETGSNVSICLIHSSGNKPSYSEVLLHSFQQQLNTEYYQVKQYKM